MSDDRTELAEIVEEATLTHTGHASTLHSYEIAGAIMEAGFTKPRVIETQEEFAKLPHGTVVRSATGTIAARFGLTLGVVLGDERTFTWTALALPVTVLWHPSIEEVRAVAD